MKNIFNISVFIFMTAICLFAQSDDADTLAKEREVIMTEKNPVGTEYYISFMKNYRDLPDKNNSLTMKLFITALKDADVRISIEGIAYEREIFIPANETKIYTMPSRAQITEYGKTQKGRAVRIVSNNPVYVYGLSTRTQTTDSYLGFPSNVLGKEYRIINYKATSRVVTPETSKPEFSVIAVEDSTEVLIIPTRDLVDGTLENDTLRVLLERGDVYQSTVAERQTSSTPFPDLTGTKIIASKPVAVFSGHECSFVPLPSKFRKTCNHLIEQVPPISSWGKHFFLGMPAKRTSYVFRVLADRDSTAVYLDNKPAYMLMAGQFIELRMKNDLTLSADKPVLVAQYSEGYGNGDNIGDPMMLYVSPTNQFLRQYYFSTPNDGDWYHYINVIVPTKAINSLRIDGLRISDGTLKRDSSDKKPVRLIDTDPEEYIKSLSGKTDNVGGFRKLGNSRYSVGAFPVPYGPHVITCSRPFGMYSYGFGNDFDAYGTMGGQSFREYVFVPDEVPPFAEQSTSENILDITVYEDRTDDSGLERIIIDETDNITVPNIQIPPGIPYYNFNLEPKNPNLPGRARIFAADMEGNVSEYTVCYVYNSAADKFVFNFSEGYSEHCSERRHNLGLFLNPQLQFHKLNFRNAGRIAGPADFGDDIASSLGIGAYYSMSLNSRFNFSANLFVENVNAKSKAGYPELISVRNPETGELDNVAEEMILRQEDTFLNIDAALEYFPDRRIYFKVGLGAAVHLLENTEIKRRIIDPGYSYFDATVLSGESNAVRPYRFYALGGAGVTKTLPIMNEYLSVFAELIYIYNFNDYIKEGAWNMNIFSLRAGLKYNF